MLRFSSSLAKKLAPIPIDKINQIFHAPIIWKGKRGLIAETDLGDGFTAHLYPPVEDGHTRVTISKPGYEPETHITHNVLANWMWKKPPAPSI